MRLRDLAAGLALVTTGTVIGLGAQQFAAADVSSGDRPVFVPIDTCRLVDTRENPAFNIGPRTTPLGREDTLRIDAQEPGTDCSGLISTEASALSLNVTVPDATEESFVTIWPDGPRPDASSLNPQPGQLVFNAVTLDLAADQSFRVFNNRGNANVIVDVNGYYENHDHDDRYYTKAQVEAQVDTLREQTRIIATTSFRATNPGVELTAGNNLGAYVSGTDGSLQTVVAPFEIPVGSRVTEVTYHYIDNDVIRNLSLGVSTTWLGSLIQAGVPAFDFDTSGASAAVRSATITPNYIVPTGMELSWSAFNSSWASTGFNLTIKGITVTYVLP